MLSLGLARKEQFYVCRSVFNIRNAGHYQDRSCAGVTCLLNVTATNYSIVNAC